MTTQAHTQTPLERLRHHVTGAIERGESVPVVEVSAPATHTPGPWHIGQGNGEGSIFCESGRMRLEAGGTTLYPVCDISRGWDEGEDNANARLIAAAPDLLQALKNARESLREITNCVEDGWFDAAEDWARANASAIDGSLSEVIARAEGRGGE